MFSRELFIELNEQLSMLKISHISKTFEDKTITSNRNWYHLLKIFTREKPAVKRVLDDISLTCNKGQVLGLLGANGAGKTTLLKVISSIIAPDYGDIAFEEQSLTQNQSVAKKKIGFLSCNAGLYQRLTAKENIYYFGRLQGLSKAQIKQNSDMLFSFLGIDDYADTLVSALSTGMTQKVSIARSLIHDPEILILDEPTTGLDIMATESLLSTIAMQKKLNKIIIFSTHHLDEIAAVADVVAVLHQGKMRFHGTIAQLITQFETQDLRTAFMKAISPSDNLNQTPRLCSDSENNSFLINNLSGDLSADTSGRTSNDILGEISTETPKARGGK